MKKLLLVMMALVIAPVLAQNEEGAGEELLTGGELYENCKGDDEEPAPTAYCKEFIYGLVQTLVSLQEMQPESEHMFCIDPNEVGLEQVTLNVTEWLAEHPERHEDPAYLVTAEALGAYYPCSQQDVSADSS